MKIQPFAPSDPSTYIETIRHGENTYVIETQADYASKELPAELATFIANRAANAATAAREAELMAAFEAKRAQEAATALRTAFETFKATDPSAQVIKAR
jgi:hypothetical protein